MTLKAAKVISRKANIDLPGEIEIREPYWYVLKGARNGGLSACKKYGPLAYRNPQKRQRNWQSWWDEKGKFLRNSVIRPKPITEPRESSDLAEFMGIFLGDGGLSERQLVITLCSDEKPYVKFVRNLMKKLFGVNPSVYQSKHERVIDVVISRTALVRFFQEKLKIRPGSKIRQKIDVPGWIKDNEKYRAPCLKGLFDTDGSIFIHKYKSKGKVYAYKRLGFTNRSLPLLESAKEMLDSLGVNNRLAGRYDIRIEAKKDIDEFFSLVGTHNPKHLIIYRK